MEGTRFNASQVHRLSLEVAIIRKLAFPFKLRIPIEPVNFVGDRVRCNDPFSTAIPARDIEQTLVRPGNLSLIFYPLNAARGSTRRDVANDFHRVPDTRRDVAGHAAAFRRSNAPLCLSNHCDHRPVLIRRPDSAASTFRPKQPRVPYRSAGSPTRTNARYSASEKSRVVAERS